MDRSEFTYFKCTNCKKIIIVPLKTIDNLGHMCSLYNEIEICCDKPRYLWGNVQKGLTSGSIKESDLPKALREKIKVTYDEYCDTPRMIIRKDDHRTDITISKGKITITKNSNEIYNEDIF